MAQTKGARADAIIKSLEEFVEAKIKTLVRTDAKAYFTPMNVLEDLDKKRDSLRSFLISKTG